MLGEKGASALSHAPQLDQLTHLYINDNNIQEEGIMEMSSSEILANLVELEIGHNDLKANGAYILSMTQNIT